ncbi:gastrotropin isoform X1 [Heterocephalus glaber]|uniref:Gastrotropin isoform X1 n=2 Tax=Heterocephalus glaber TaxID=10181 RepID=A0AAX6RGJ8_HETGA|nr:gastrotropin isoform X1 [Heterocephalus glaber]
MLMSPCSGFRTPASPSVPLPRALRLMVAPRRKGALWDSAARQAPPGPGAEPASRGRSRRASRLRVRSLVGWASPDGILPGVPQFPQRSQPLSAPAATQHGAPRHAEGTSTGWSLHVSGTLAITPFVIRGQSAEGACKAAAKLFGLPVSKIMSMAFNGKFQAESEKNYDEFMKRLGLPSDVLEKGRNAKIITEVQQDGQDFTWSQSYSKGHLFTNKFTIGKESDLVSLGGKNFKGTVKMEGGKLSIEFPNYRQTSEIVGDKLVEVSTIGDVSYERVSKRLA